MPRTIWLVVGAGALRVQVTDAVRRSEPSGYATVARRRHADRGSGTLLMLALIGLIWSVAVMAMQVGGVRAARHRAYAAADLAALAASAHALDGARSACRSASAIARSAGARLRRCALDGRVSDVVVTSDARNLLPLGHLTATARARAGPEDVPEP